MGKHQKRLKADKAKIKLKQSKTKFLPKGLNVTKTDFKIKPIVLPEQLKETDESVPLSKRKLDVKGLLSRVKHYNENVRFTACGELSEMMKIHTEEFTSKHLLNIIKNISTLMQDRERKVRKAAVTAISTILEIVPDTKLEPFFKHFSTNISCAMTHIDRNIQEDSLLFLDCFIKSNSGLISEKLLPNFFALISKLRRDSEFGRTLKLNLGSKITSVAWRVKVLSRLHAVLERILENQDFQNDVKKAEVYIDGESCSAYPLYKESFCKVLENDIMISRTNENKATEKNALNRYIVILVPLLYEIWIEVVPEKIIGKSVDENTVLKEDAAAILSCIMKTLYLLWKYVKNVEDDAINVKSVFLSNEGTKFLTHLFVNFPYCQTEKDSMQKKINDASAILGKNTDSKCVGENLLICYMFCVLKLNNSPVRLKIELEIITSYIIKCLVNKNYVAQSNIKYLTMFLRTSLVEHPKIWKRAGADLIKLLKNTIMFYNNVVNGKYKREVFDILFNVVDIPYLKDLPYYRQWLSTLPDLLCQSAITDVLVNALLNLSKKNIQVFYTALQRRLSKILENLDTLKIILTSDSLINNEEVIKRNIVNIFFFVPYLNESHINQYLITHEDSPYSRHFKNILTLRKEFRKGSM